MKPAHRRGPYQRHAAAVTKAARATPHAICWRCGRTLPHHPPHRNGKPATWHAGHTIDGATNPQPWLNPTRPPPPGPWLAPEASTCNTQAGATHGNTTRATGYTWP